MKLPVTYRGDQGMTVEGASPELLRELLEVFEFEAARCGAPSIASVSAAGIGRAEVEDGLSSVGLVAPEELIVWWGWHNGVDLFARAMPRAQLSLLRSLELYKEERLGLGELEWNPLWIRISGDTGQALAVECDDSRGPIRVRHSDVQNASIQPGPVAQQVVSLCTTVTWWLLGISKGWMAWSPKWGWERDFHAYPVEWAETLAF